MGNLAYPVHGTGFYLVAAEQGWLGGSLPPLQWLHATTLAAPLAGADVQLPCTCGWNTAEESAQTSTKSDFMVISTFEADEGHSSPRLCCIFMHLWPHSIWLRGDIKVEILQRWLVSQEPASTLPSRSLAAPSNGFGPTVCWGGGGGWLSERLHASERLRVLSFLFLFMLWKCWWEHFWSPAARACDVLLAQLLQLVWQFVSCEKSPLCG